MEDDLEFDFEDFERECEEFEKELSAIESHIDSAFEWIDLLFELQEAVERFNVNMSSINKVADYIKDAQSQENFVCGTLLSGVVSAYEGFVHELFNACCQKSEYIDRAKTRISNLSEKESEAFESKSLQQFIW
ncbi:hypothetical protein [Pseudoalteromonas xiamenensis]